MARALTAGELSSYRSEKQHSRLYLAIHDPATVLTARVDGDPADDDRLASLTIKSAAWGSGYSSAPADLLVYFGSTSGAYDKGMARLRSALSGTPTTMDLGEISEISFSDEDYITVVEEFPLVARHVRVTGGAVYMDYDVAYSDQHADPDPVPVLGPNAADWMAAPTTTFQYGDGTKYGSGKKYGPTSELARVFFDASDSWVTGGSITGYSWSFPGAFSYGNASTATPQAIYTTAGTYRVSCTVTADNGKTFTGHRYVYIYDDSNQPTTQFRLDSISGAWDRGGWSFRVTLYAEAGISNVRDRAMVTLFAKDWYDGTQEEIGPIQYRENVVAQGWISSESITWDAETGSVSFEVQGPQHWLNIIQGFPAGIEDTTSTPSAWTEYQSLTLDKALDAFLRWRTTATRMMDVVELTGDSRGISVFEAGAGKVWAQMNQSAWAAILARLACDRYGRLFVQVEPPLVPTGDRGSWPTVHTIQTQDLRRPVAIERRVTPPLGLVDLSGIAYSGGSGTPLFSLAPGHVPKWHGGIEAIDRLALTDQSQANTLAGLVLDWRNNEYPSLALALASNHRMLDVVPYQVVSLTISSDDTVRGVSETLTLIPRRVSFRYDHRTGLMLTDIDAEALTTGVDGVDGDLPSTPPSSGPPPSPPPAWDPEPDVDLGTGKVVGVGGIGGFAYTEDITAVSPDWSLMNTGLPTPDPTEIHFLSALVNDPLVPYRAACVWHSTDSSGTPQGDGTVLVNTNWRDGSTSWSSKLTEAQAKTAIESAISDTISDLTFGGLYAFAKDTDDTGTLLLCCNFKWDETGGETTDQQWKMRVLRSTDWGDNWVVGGEIPGRASGGFEYKNWTHDRKELSGLAIDDWGIGEIAFDGTYLYLCAKTPRRTLEISAIQYSADWGATWASSPPVEGGGNATYVARGPAASRCDSTGRLYIARWKKDESSHDHYIVSTYGLGGSLTDQLTITRASASTADGTADARGMLEILADNSWVFLKNASGDTEVYVNGALEQTVSSEVYRTVHGFEEDADIAYLGRSWVNTEKAAGGGDEVVVRMTDDGFGSAPSDVTGDLYSAGISGVVGIISDWSSD